MPNYDYVCSSCKNVQEEQHPMAGPKEKIVCNKCGGTEMSKGFSTPYVKFNGPGWQTNDSRGIAKIDGGQEIDSSFMK
jgi:putative FmdB family regulatory protein